MNTIKSISPHSNKFLTILDCVDPFPEVIYYQGQLPEDRMPTVAIVGSRKPTSYGKEVTSRLSHDLAARGVVIVSGLALGIDAIAHQAALDAGGTTIAVSPAGLHKIYPSTNQRLGEQILANGGAVISEYPAGVEPMRHHFLDRNRLVSGLADAIIITEAASRSGTLNTAAHALNQGKDVFVVPGNITSPMSVGCNQLLRQGANPVLSIDDILSVMMPNVSEQTNLIPLGSNKTEDRIIKLLKSGLRDGDEIARQINCPAHEFNTALTMLEINGIIKPLGANQWALS